MKNAFLQLCIILLAISGIHAIRLLNSNTIIGQVSSPDALTYVWAIQNQDSVIAQSENGKFAIKVKPGKWDVLLHTNSPYKNMLITNVTVTADRPTNLGEIKLQQ